jgi:hypothetical protein
MTQLTRRLVRGALLVAVAGAVLLAPAVPATAAPPVVNLNCTITVTTDIHPGVTTQLRHLASTSHGLTGTATCTGTVNGQPVTGIGSFAVNTQVLGNCTQANGASTFVLKIPTAGGTKTVAGRYTVHIPSAVPLTGDLTGTVTIVSAVGDCVTTPITRTTSVMTAHIT